jgi:hypothetical protein
MQKSAKTIKQTPLKAKRERASSPDPSPKKSRTKSAEKKMTPSSQPTEFGSITKNRPLVKAESTRKKSPASTQKNDKKVTAQPIFSVESILEPVKPKRAMTSFFAFTK